MAIAVFGQGDSLEGGAMPARRLSIGAALSVGPTVELGAVVVPEIAECDTLDAGSALSWLAAFLVDRPLSRTLSLQLRLGVGIESGELRTRSSSPLLLPGENGAVVEGRFDHVLRFDRTLVSAALLLRAEPLERLELLAGLELARGVAGSQTFEQHAVEPETLLFGGRRIAAIRSGTIVPAAPVVVGAQIAVGYRLPLSRRSWLVPELSLAIPITSMAAEGSAWRRVRIGAGASLRFDLLETPPAPPPIDTPVVARIPVLRPIITTSPSVVEVRVDEYDSIEALPLLNQIFFAEGSAEIPSRYHLLDSAAAESFSTAQLTGSALDAYYDLLNVIGTRMRRLPEATLAINGYRNGREAAGISRRRADAIRRYLVDVWSIAPRRLRSTGGALPPSPARETVAEGFEENARAQLEPSDPNVIAPVIRNHLLRVATPPSVVFYPRAESEAGVTAWRLDVMQDSTLWRRFEGAGSPPDSIVWDWRSDRRELPQIPMSLGYRLAVTDSTGQRVVTPLHDIEVQYRSLQQMREHRENDTVIQSYSLLLFNYDSPSVSPADQELLRAIAGRIGATSIVRVTGYTDSLGLESHNRDLAFRRAGETARILRELSPAGAAISVDPNGGERERFPYDTPEGRSHCRTVIIEVRTPDTGGE